MTTDDLIPVLERPAPQLAPAPAHIKLDLACGQSPAEGFDGVDIWPGAKHVVNLMKYPWPWPDGSIAELRCSHFAEHIPMIYVDDAGDEVPMGTPGARDALFRFFDECHRVLAPEGWLEVIVPAAKNHRGFQDPTHRRFFVPETFFYLSRQFREINKLDHYNVVCDFFINVAPGCTTEMTDALNLMHQEVAAAKFNECWNIVSDYQARLKKL